MFRGAGGDRVCRVYRSRGVCVDRLSLHARRVCKRTLEEERMSYLWSLPAMQAGEVRSVVALKPGVGDHAPERLASNELGSWNNQRDIWQIEIALAKGNSLR